MVNAMRRNNRGFTLLELVISLLVIVILYGVLSVYLGRIAESAERAAVQGMLGQLQAQINIRMTKFYIEGRPEKANALLLENPFDWIPSQAKLYAGEINKNVNSRVLEKGFWYFDSDANELIYKTRRNTYLKVGEGDGSELRFVLKLNHAMADNPANGANYNVSVAPLWPYTWKIKASSK